MSQLSSAARKINRAAELGWTRQLPAWCGPGRFIRYPKRQRRELLANLARMKANDAIRAIVKRYESDTDGIDAHAAELRRTINISRHGVA